jgi:hypothetical protein
MLGKGDWIAARAEPVWHSANTITGAEGDDDFAAGLNVLWCIHIDGRPPYEFEEERRAPFWVMKGVRHGRHWYTVRLRATHGLLREVGVPCRVHPEKPDKIDIDWSRAYDEHQPIWDRMDAVAKEVTSRREGPLGKLLAPIQFAGLPKFTPQEQEAIARETEAELARYDKGTGVGAPGEAPVDVATLQVESQLIQAQQKEAKQIRKRGIPYYATVIDVSGPTGPSSWFYTVRLEIHEAQGGSRVIEHRQGLNYAMVQRLKPGSRQRIRVDSADPQRMAFEAF